MNRMTPELFEQFYAEVPPALASGKFARPKEHVTIGLDNVCASPVLVPPLRSRQGKR